MTATQAYSRQNLTELILLFTGDAFSQGCPRVKLVLVICEVLKPKNLSELRTEVFGGMDTEMIPSLLMEVLEHGYNQYEKAKKG